MNHPQPNERLTWLEFKQLFPRFVNHYLVEPSIWAIGVYGIAMSILATYTWGFFALHEYSFAALTFFLKPSEIQSLDLWFDAYPYSLLIFGSYILALYWKFRKFNKGYLALPVWMLTYSMWDFTGIGVNIVKGYSIIWLGISLISLLYFIPIRKQFKIQISLIALLAYIGFGDMSLQNIFLTLIPYLQHYPLVAGQTVFSYLTACVNELTFCLLCYFSIFIRPQDSHGNQSE